MRKEIPWIHLLRVIACLMVVCLHCQTMASSSFILDVWAKQFDVIVSLVTKPCVPLFFMITGYLILPYKNEDDIFGFYKKRILRVLYPLLIWGVIYAILPYFLGICSKSQMLSELILSPIKAPHYIGGILWYLFILIGIYLAIPFLSNRIYSNKKILKLWLGIWFVTSIIFILKQYEPELLGENKWEDNFDLTIYFSGYMGYLLMGYYLHRFSWHIERNYRFVDDRILLVILILINLVINRKLQIDKSFLSVGTVMLSIFVFMLFMRVNMKPFGGLYRGVVELSRMSFGIYLSHMFVLHSITKHVFEYMGSGIIVQILVMALTFIGAYILTKCISFLPWKKYIIG